MNKCVKVHIVDEKGVPYPHFGFDDQGKKIETKDLKRFQKVCGEDAPYTRNGESVCLGCLQKSIGNYEWVK